MTQNTFSDTANIGEDFIQHHGVKGMKWGVRKDRDAPKTGGTASKPAPKTGGTASKPAPSKTKYNTFEIVNEYPDGTREVYVGGVGSPGRFLTEEEQEEADILAGELEETRNEYNKMFDGFVEMLNKDGDYESDPKLSSSEKEVIRKRQGEYEQKATVAAERYEEKLDRWTTLSNKARKLEGEHYKNNPNERRRPAYMPTPGKTTFQTKPDKAGPNEARIREDWLKKSTKHMDMSELGSDFLQHYGVKGMKWGVRKDKRGKVTGVLKKTPFRGTNEYDGPNADGKAQLIKEYADPKVLKDLKGIYKDARVPIKRGIKSLNKSDKYKNADLTNSKSKIFKDYHTDVSNVVKEKLTASTTLKLRDNDRFVIDHYDYDSRKDSAPRLGTVMSTTYTPERRTPEAKEFADSVKYRHNTRINDITDAAKSDGLNYIASASLSTTLGQPIAIGPLLVASTSTAYKVNSRREKSEYANEFMKSRKFRHSGLDENTDPQDFILSFGYARNGFIEDVKMEVKPRKLGHSDLSELGSDFLMHHGVKGMKWGVRKDGKPRGYQGPSSTKKKVKKAVSNVVDPDKRAKRKLKKAKAKYERQRLNEQASGYEKATEESKKNSRKNEKASDPKPKSKSVAELSDDDLRKVIQRIDLEKRYATLMEERRPKSRTEKVNKFLKKAATQAAENAAKQLITKGVGAAVTRATGVPINTTNTKAATNALKTAANDATKDVTKATQKQAAAQPKTPSTPTPKASTPTNPPKAPRTPFTREPLVPIKSENVRTVASPTKSPSFSDILSKSYNDTITSGTTQRGNSWLDEFDTNRDFVTLNQERRKRR